MLFDVAILGGGAVGATLALMLAQLNYQVLIIEKKFNNKVVSDIDARTVALSYASVHILKNLEIWQHLQSKAVNIDEVSVSVSGCLGRSRLQASVHNVPFLGQVVAFDELEKVLFDALSSMSNVKVMRPAILDHFQLQQESWELHIEAESSLKVSSRLLVAADGIDSSLRQAAGIGVSKTEYGHVAVLANVQRQQAPISTAIERFMPQGAIALLPWRNQLATCVYTATSERAADLMAMNNSDYLIACQDALGKRDGKLIDIGRRVSLPLTMQVATQQVSNRLLLLGNAAHSLHPIAAQGLNLSLRDIWQLKNQLTQFKLQDLGSADFLTAYQAARKGDQGRVIFATDKIAKYLSGGALPMSLRALGVALFDSLSPAKSLFTRYSMGLM